MAKPVRDYIVLCGQIVGSRETGFECVYGFDGDRYATRAAAKSAGFEIRGSDDFNIGVLENGKLVSLDWMSKVVESNPDELAKIAEQIDLCSETA